MIERQFVHWKYISFLGILVFTGNLFAAGLMRDITSMEIVQDMIIGWNLGNSLDATGGSGLGTETSWDNPTTTKAMIDMVKAKGFKTVRIPVTWNKHFGSAPDYAIDQAWMNRVEEVVNYVLDNGMYAILNSHHDEWVTLTPASRTEVSNKLSRLWTQISERFKDYSDYLIFETLNEPRLYGTQYEWTGGTAEARGILNEYNAAVVNAIRSTGGNNALRHVMIPTHAATAIAAAQDDLVIPSNDSRIIVSQHTYWPYSFTMQEPGTASWGTTRDKSDCDAELDRIYDKFVRNGIPVVIGEWGSINKNNTAARVIHAEYYARAVREREMLPVWWDNGYKGDGGFALLDRSSLSWCFEEIADALMRGVGDVTSIKSEPVFGKKLSFNGISNKAGNITYSLTERADVSLSIFDMRGRVILSLTKPGQSAGNYEFNLIHAGMSGGLYVVNLKADNRSLSRSIEIIK